MISGEMGSAGDYDSARSADPVLPSAARNIPALAPLLSGLQLGPDIAQDTVLLLPPLNAKALAVRLEQENLPGVTFEDLADNIHASIAELRATAALWLGVGVDSTGAV